MRAGGRAIKESGNDIEIATDSCLPTALRIGLVKYLKLFANDGADESNGSELVIVAHKTHANLSVAEDRQARGFK